ncbi:Ionotropic glutamate receptor domain and NMDA receptor family and Extracellular ligand-binding receptor domain and Glutamate receptor, L-glutamate/glycine-binding domain and Periplasmic binding protein-like I domain-containing protein [Strongyloides ratti]|uniref:Glutamate receptor ionotropic, kainate 2 n=1 Tax=Strongyloides ratti TaxID=34506 RepID=A0A090LDA0_STRRB|nr:Ionotropic glutamate receptor domain and NMDA receptor family and Extracellular ligand-binding receptor domain and Glutamate receptor, L-glutamate/glycine-binding domain and Periplasmic binding protein-like I domain-containing protein [Strongyloides ratti]CEF66118.1 Ionotropic glutamate receptor domain and NMDA receptor family and Extracellular ligand-binding receptor domain and Glutamate receptor, L-glutamate/glycine-binding domain and Periplasmic binding protein-like I domain-containing prote
MLYLKAEIIIILFYLPFLLSIDSVKFGAIFRKAKDAHLAAAISYAVEWNNNRIGHYPEIEYIVDYVEPIDYYEAAKKACQLIEKQKVVALFSTADRNMNMQIQDITTKIDIPFFSTINDFSNDKLSILKNNKENGIWSTKIQMFPKEYIDEAISDLIKHWKWNRLIIVYSDIRRINRLITFLENPSYSYIRFILIRVVKNDFLGAAKQVKELEDCALDEEKFCNDMNRILVDMNSGDTYKFFIASLQLGLIDLHHWFLMTSLDLRNIDMNLFKHNHARFIGINLINEQFLLNYNNTFNLNNFKNYIINEWIKEGNDINKLELSEAILMFDAIYLAVEVFKEAGKEQKLIINDKSNTQCKTSIKLSKPYIYGKDIIEKITKKNILGLSGDLSRIHTPMYQLTNYTYRIDLLGYNGVINDIGFWEPTNDVYVNMTGDSKAQLQRNVKVSDELKPHFRVTTVLERPYVMYKKNHFELDKNSQFEGFCIDLLHQLSKDLGFTYTIHVVKDRKYGSDIYKNGTWDGIVGEILRGEADMAVSPFTVNFQRAQALDFTKPFLSLGISILYKIPADHQPDLFSFLNPLSLEIWICILLSIIVLTVGMYFVAQITPYEWNLNFSCCTAHQPHPGAQYSLENSPVVLTNNYSFWNTLWYVMSTMLKGGCDFGPRSFSTRLLGGTWWMFTLVIVSAYTANLAAVLTISRPYIPIKNLDDLANQTDISYGTLVGGSTSQFFMESKIESHVKMWEYMKNRDVFVSSNAAGVEKVLNENYAYLMESTSLEYEVQQNCNLTQIGGVLGSKGYGIALQKHSEWTDRMSRQILLYAKRGIIEMKKQKWWRNQGVPCTGVGSSVKQQRVSLTFHNVSGLFLILSAGLVISIFIVIIEFYITSKKIAKKENIAVKKQIAKEMSFALRLNNISEHRKRNKKHRNNDEISKEDAVNIDMTNHI